MNDPWRCDVDQILVEDLTWEDAAAAADVAAFFEGAEQVGGLTLATATATGRDLVVVLEDACDGARTFRLRVEG